MHRRSRGRLVPKSTSSSARLWQSWQSPACSSFGIRRIFMVLGVPSFIGNWVALTISMIIVAVCPCNPLYEPPDGHNHEGHRPANGKADHPKDHQHHHRANNQDKYQVQHQPFLASSWKSDQFSPRYLVCHGVGNLLASLSWTNLRSSAILVRSAMAVSTFFPSSRPSPRVN